MNHIVVNKCSLTNFEGRFQLLQDNTCNWLVSTVITAVAMNDSLPEQLRQPDITFG